MKLTDLEAEFVRYETRTEGVPYIKPAGGNWGDPFTCETRVPVATLAEAEGVQLLCPGCFQKNGGAVGTHMIDVTFHGRGVPDHRGSHNRDGKPSRWAVSGSGLHDLTTHPSVDCGCWHGWITNGDAK